MEDASIPRRGIHSYRVLDVAVVDVAFTVLAAYIISRKHFIGVFILLIFISIILHTAKNIETKTNKWLLDLIKK